MCFKNLIQACLLLYKGSSVNMSSLFYYWQIWHPHKAINEHNTILCQYRHCSPFFFHLFLVILESCVRASSISFIVYWLKIQTGWLVGWLDCRAHHRLTPSSTKCRCLFETTGSLWIHWIQTG